MPRNFKIGNSRVLESRESADGITIRRRRETSDGKHRFTTYERIEYPNLAVIKKDGSRELFDREKLAQAIRRSVGKFFKSEVEVEEIINSVEEAIYETGENEVLSSQIGELVLDELAAKNDVAYVRFASVFHKFKTLDDFVKILEQRRTSKKEQ
jgi:transcriptional repressor NrdR